MPIDIRGESDRGVRINSGVGAILPIGCEPLRRLKKLGRRGCARILQRDFPQSQQTTGHLRALERPRVAKNELGQLFHRIIHSMEYA